MITFCFLYTATQLLLDFRLYDTLKNVCMKTDNSICIGIFTRAAVNTCWVSSFQEKKSHSTTENLCLWHYRSDLIFQRFSKQ